MTSLYATPTRECHNSGHREVRPELGCIPNRCQGYFREGDSRYEEF